MSGCRADIAVTSGLALRLAPERGVPPVLTATKTSTEINHMKMIDPFPKPQDTFKNKTRNRRNKNNP